MAYHPARPAMTHPEALAYVPPYVYNAYETEQKRKITVQNSRDSKQAAGADEPTTSLGWLLFHVDSATLSMVLAR
jgi:hypothetical protein